MITERLYHAIKQTIKAESYTYDSLKFAFGFCFSAKDISLTKQLVFRASSTGVRIILDISIKPFN
jgi:hypothetical protein